MFYGKTNEIIIYNTDDGELQKDSVVRNFRTAATESEEELKALELAAKRILERGNHSQAR